MKTKVVIPVSDKNGLNARIADHFGRAPFYAVLALDENKKIESVETVENSGEHCGGQGHMHENILSLQPNVLIAYGMGPRGLSNLQEAGAEVLRANADTVKDVMDSYLNSKLEELTEGCHQARHHGHCR
jgi:predicted Fe-Mo cluster-binding NifX family protein